MAALPRPDFSKRLNSGPIRCNAKCRKKAQRKARHRLAVRLSRVPLSVHLSDGVQRSAFVDESCAKRCRSFCSGSGSRPRLAVHGVTDSFLRARCLTKRAAKPPADVPLETSKAAVPMHTGHIKNRLFSDSSVSETSPRRPRAEDRRNAKEYRSHRRGSIARQTRAESSLPSA